MKILLSGFCLLSFLSLSAQDSLTILFAGDAMMHQKQLDNTRRGDFFDLGSYFDNIEREVKAADIAVVNFEVPLGGEPYSGYPAFSAPEDFALALQKAGFDFSKDRFDDLAKIADLSVPSKHWILSESVIPEPFLTVITVTAHIRCCSVRKIFVSSCSTIPMVPTV